MPVRPARTLFFEWPGVGSGPTARGQEVLPPPEGGKVR